MVVTPAARALRGLELAEQMAMPIPSDSALGQVAAAIIDGREPPPAALRAAHAGWQTQGDQSAPVLGIAWLLMGGPNLAGARRPARYDLFEELSAELTRIDWSVEDQLQAAFDVAASTAMARHGQTVTRGQSGDLKDQMLSVDPRRAVSLIPPPQRAALGQPGRPVDDALHEMREALRSIVQSGQAAAIAAVAAMFGIPVDELHERYGTRLEGDLRRAEEAAEDVLRVELEGALGEGEDFSEGESDGLRIPAGVGWALAAIAAGAAVATVSGRRRERGDPIVETDQFGRPQSADGASSGYGLGTGPTIADAIATEAATPRPDGRTGLTEQRLIELDKLTATESGLVLTDAREWQWAFRRRPITPFKPHFDRDGDFYETDFEHMERCAWDPSDWPYVSVLAPKDHVTCTCRFKTGFTMRDVMDQRAVNQMLSGSLL